MAFKKIIQKKIWLPFLVVFISIAVFYINRPNYLSSESNLLPLPSIPSGTKKINDEPDNSKFVKSEYINQKFNFKLDYESAFISGGKPFTKGWVEEKNNQVTYVVQRVEESDIVISETFTFYEVNESDKNNISTWWTNNIKTEVDGGIVPSDYDINTDLSELVCEGLESWKAAPPGIIVSLNGQAIERTKLIGPETYSVYLYYNFGKPFIVNFASGNSGAGINPNWLCNIRSI